MHSVIISCKLGNEYFIAQQLKKQLENDKENLYSTIVRKVLSMKRFIAFSIDLIIVELFIYFYIVFLFSMEAAERPIAKFSYFIGFLAYNFIFDYFFGGRSIGKRLVGIKVVFLNENKKSLYCYTHGIFRYLSGLFSPILGFYYLIKKKLPYDNFFNIVTENV